MSEHIHGSVSLDGSMEVNDKLICLVLVGEQANKLIKLFNLLSFEIGTGFSVTVGVSRFFVDVETLVQRVMDHLQINKLVKSISFL